MRVKWFFSQSSKLAELILNEAYFKFTSSVLLRVDCQGDNDTDNIPNGQKIFFEKLCTLEQGSKPIFKKVTFCGKNKIQILLLIPWNDEYVSLVEDMIRKSWPSLFVKA